MMALQFPGEMVLLDHSPRQGDYPADLANHLSEQAIMIPVDYSSLSILSDKGLIQEQSRFVCFFFFLI